MFTQKGVRNLKEAQENIEKLIDLKQTKGKIYYEQLDIGQMESVRKFAAKLQNKFTKIDILVNNGKQIHNLIFDGKLNSIF